MFKLKSTFCNNCGIIGDITDMTYDDGKLLQVGDVVDIKGKFCTDTAFVVKLDDDYIVMGCGGCSFRLGKSNSLFDDSNIFTIKLNKKYYNVVDGETIGYVTAYELPNNQRLVNVNRKEMVIELEPFDESIECKLLG